MPILRQTIHEVPPFPPVPASPLCYDGPESPVQGGRSPEEETPVSYSHVLVALDFSEVSDRIMQRALDLARLYEARVSLLHMVDYLPPLGFADDFTPSPAVLIDEQELVERGARSLARYAERFGLGAETERIVQIGSPRQEIVAIAAQRGADLIVIGSHGRHGLRRLLGTTASAVLNDAVCDVLAVRVHD